MISDVLCDACEEIEEYRKNYPENYGGCSGELGNIVTVMRSFTAYCDICPGGGLDDLADELIHELANLDVSKLKEILERAADRGKRLRKLRKLGHD